MDSITDMLMQHLGSSGLSQLSQHVGADPQTTSSAMSAAVPVLVSAMARNAQQPQGAQDLHRALQQHNGGLLDNVSRLMQNPDQADGGGILEHVLGNQQSQVQQGLAQATGLNNSQIGRLLTIVAPLVISYFARQQHQQGLDPGGLAQMLGQQHQQVQQANPQAAQMIGQLLGGGRGGQQGADTDLGDALGGLLGGGRR